jgi:hypothetical protein
LDALPWVETLGYFHRAPLGRREGESSVGHFLRAVRAGLWQ